MSWWRPQFYILTCSVQRHSLDTSTASKADKLPSPALRPPSGWLGLVQKVDICYSHWPNGNLRAAIGARRGPRIDVSNLQSVAANLGYTFPLRTSKLSVFAGARAGSERI